MTLWGNTDAAGSSPVYAPGLFRKHTSRANANLLYGNTSPGAIRPNKTIGVFGVDTTEMAVANASIVSYIVTNPGSGYFANATVTVTGNGTANAQANSLGRIALVNVVASGNQYSTPASASATIAAPPAQAINALTAVSNAAAFITIASNVFQNGDFVKYLVAAGNTVIGGLANNNSYYVVAANTTGIALSLAPGGANIALVATVSETGHTFTGQTATAVPVLSGIGHAPQHAGWVVRTVGTGNRAGRIQYETLVAMGSMSVGGGGNTIFKPA